MSNVIFIRHGQASFGASNYDQLSELGQRQSMAIGAQLVRSGHQPSTVYSGQMQRQLHTAELALLALGGEFPVNSLADFNEYDSKGVFENYLPAVLDQYPEIRDRMTPDDFQILKQPEIFQKVFFPVMQQWIDGAPADRVPVESWHDFQQRVIRGIEHLREQASEGRTQLVFTSGGVISVAMTYALGLDPIRSLEFNWRTANGSITHMLATERGLALESYNQYTHLQDPEQQLKVTYI